MRTVLTLLLGTVRRLGRSRRDVLRENLALRHQLAMCERSHRSLGLDAPEGRRPGARAPGAPLQRRAVLGGLHQEYIWAA